MRYVALGAGIGWGASKSFSISAADAAAAKRHEYERQEHRIEEARKAYQNKVNAAKNPTSKFALRT